MVLFKNNSGVPGFLTDSLNLNTAAKNTSYHNGELLALYFKRLRKLCIPQALEWLYRPAHKHRKTKTESLCHKLILSMSSSLWDKKQFLPSETHCPLESETQLCRLSWFILAQWEEQWVFVVMTKVQFLLVTKSYPKEDTKDVMLYLSVCDNNSIPVVPSIPGKIFPILKGFKILNRDAPGTRTKVLLAQKDVQSCRCVAHAPGLTWSQHSLWFAGLCFGISYN